MGINYVSFIGYGISVTDIPCFKYLFESPNDFEDKRSSFGRKNKIRDWKFYDLVDFLIHSINNSEETPETSALWRALNETRGKESVTVNISLVFEEVSGEDGCVSEIYILSKYTYLSLNLREESEISPVSTIRKSDRNAFASLTLSEEKGKMWFGGYQC